jgi:hypothetical protein
MDKLKPTFSVLDDRGVTNIPDLLGADFGNRGRVYGISFFNSNGVPVNIIDENCAGLENEFDIKSSTI